MYHAHGLTRSRQRPGEFFEKICIRIDSGTTLFGSNLASGLPWPQDGLAKRGEGTYGPTISFGQKNIKKQQFSKWNYL